MKKIAPSRDALYMHTLRAIHTSGFQWVECRHNVTVPDPSLWGYVWKGEMFVPKWLSKPNALNVKDIILTCKCKTAKCAACKCAKNNLLCLPMCHCQQKCTQK